jgi:hypothetical protein
MAGLRERGHDEGLRARVAAGRPVLGICLGLQLALEWTDEDGGVAGLGLVHGSALRLEVGRVPRMGWAEVDDRGAFYFAHSYAAETRARRPGRRASSPRRAPARSSAASSTRRRAARAASCAVLEEALIPLPRLIPCLDVARAASSRASASRRCATSATRSSSARRTPTRRRRARVPRRPGDARGRRRSSSSCARRRAARDPVHRRRRRALARGRGRAARRGADKVAVNSAALARPSS